MTTITTMTVWNVRKKVLLEKNDEKGKEKEKVEKKGEKKTKNNATGQLLVRCRRWN